MSRASQTGKTGEALAAEFLQAKGYEIIARNFRAEAAELDIIAKDQGCLVFVEVKTCRSRSFGEPETWVDDRKVEHMTRAADLYLEQNQLDDVDCRYDIIAVDLSGPQPDIRHLENAIWPD